MHFILNRRPCEVHNHRTLGQILESLLFRRVVTRGHFYCGECADISLQKLLTETAAVPLSCRSFDDLESQPRGFPLKRVDLTVAVLSLVEVRASVDKLHSVAQHAIHESG